MSETDRVGPGTPRARNDQQSPAAAMLTNPSCDMAEVVVLARSKPEIRCQSEGAREQCVELKCLAGRDQLCALARESRYQVRASAQVKYARRGSPYSERTVNRRDDESPNPKATLVPPDARVDVWVAKRGGELRQILD